MRELFFTQLSLLKLSFPQLSYDDVIYFIQNAIDHHTVKTNNATSLSQSHKKAPSTTADLPTDLKEKIYQWNQADHLIYEHFLQKFEKRKRRFGLGRLEKEVEELKYQNARAFRTCIEKVTSNLAEIPEALQPFKPDPSVQVQGFVPRKNLSRADWDMCRGKMLPELKFARMLRNKQHMLYSTPERSVHRHNARADHDAKVGVDRDIF